MSVPENFNGNPVPGPTTAADDTAMTLSAERLITGTQWVPTGRLVIRRRIVTETRTVEVTLRREELVVEEVGPPEVVPGEPAPADSVHGAHEPLVIVLRQEVPDVTVHVEPYELVRVHVGYGSSERELQAQVRHEEVDFGLTGSPTEGS